MGAFSFSPSELLSGALSDGMSSPPVSSNRLAISSCVGYIHNNNNTCNSRSDDKSTLGTEITGPEVL